jgi:hypothetical protein
LRAVQTVRIGLEKFLAVRTKCRGAEDLAGREGGTCGEAEDVANVVQPRRIGTCCQLHERIGRAHSCRRPLFLFRPDSRTVNICMCILPLFDGHGIVFVDDNHVGPAVQLPVLLE